MSREKYAVITGDIVKSSMIESDYARILESIASDIINYQDEEFKFDIFRGDSFQGFVKKPSDALKISVLIRSGLRRQSITKSIDSIWDARIAIGIGTIKNDADIEKMNLKKADGEAFVRSGRALDSMKKEEVQIKISTGNTELDNEFDSVCPLLDVIIRNWTTSQAEAVYMQLLEGITQEEIGSRLGISQRASGKRLELSNVDKMKKYLNRYKELVEWRLLK